MTWYLLQEILKVISPTLKQAWALVVRPWLVCWAWIKSHGRRMWGHIRKAPPFRIPSLLQPHHENPGHRDGPEDKGERRRVNPKSSKEGASTWGSRSLWTRPLEQGQGSPTWRR